MNINKLYKIMNIKSWQKDDIKMQIYIDVYTYLFDVYNSLHISETDIFEF